MLRQYRKNPKGFAFIRIDDMLNQRSTLKFKFKSCIHYVSSSLISKNKNFLKETPCKFLTILAMPLGVIFYAYVIFNTRDNKNLPTSS
jgi:hypothetical protein